MTKKPIVTTSGTTGGAAVGVLGSVNDQWQTGTNWTTPQGPAPAPVPTTSPLQITTSSGNIIPQKAGGYTANYLVGVIGGNGRYSFNWVWADGYTAQTNGGSFKRTFPPGANPDGSATVQVSVVSSDGQKKQATIVAS